MKPYIITYILSMFDKNKEEIEIKVTSCSRNIANEVTLAIRDLLKEKGLFTGGSSVTTESFL